MTSAPDTRTRIAIVGGGAAGTLVAAELLRLDAPVDVDIFEPSGTLGLGLAYSTRDDHHLVNVPAAKMSAVADEPDHLVRWLAANDHDSRGEAFPRRSVYGEYLRTLLADRLFAARSCEVRDITATVTTLRSRDDHRIDLATDDARVSTYDHAVLALGNVAAPPAIDLPDDPRAFPSPWVAGALDGDGLPDASSVLVVGTGLTAVDAALSLADAAPGSTITLVSRNGHLPFTHLPGPLRTPWPSDEFPTDIASFDELLATWHEHVRRGLAAGHDWRDVVDGLRPKTQLVWRALDEAGQARFLREQRRNWEARRNRAAPDVGARLDELVASGRLVVRTGAVTDARATAEGIRVDVGGEPVLVDRLVSCTGPTADVRRTTNPLLRDLFDTGMATPDPHRLAIRTDADGHLVAADGSADERLSTLGWLRRGELWETLAIPEIRVQAKAIAERIAATATRAVEAPTAG